MCRSQDDVRAASGGCQGIVKQAGDLRLGAPESLSRMTSTDPRPLRLGMSPREAIHNGHRSFLNNLLWDSILISESVENAKVLLQPFDFIIAWDVN